MLWLLRIEWPEATQAKELGGYDKAGIDLLVVSTPRLSMVAQCKGFEVSNTEFGDSQLNQCLESIEKYSRSGLLSDLYLLIVNRQMKAEIRSRLEARLALLVSEGRTSKAELVDCRAMVARSFEAMRVLMADRIAKASAGRIICPLKAETTSAVEIVPLERSKLVTNPNQLLKESPATIFFADPVHELLSNAATPVVLLGEAGCGKTTTILRCLEHHAGPVLYVPAASIPKEAITNRAVFFEHCFDSEGLIDFGDGEESEIQCRLARTAAGAILDHEDSTIAFVIDGLDEAVAVTQPGGMQQLFNHLRQVRGRIILTCRSELWNERRCDFAAAFGDISKNEQYKRQHVTVLRLLLWDDQRIVQLGMSYRDMQTDPEARRRIEDFIVSVQQGGYTQHFGDIPRRPLFLRCILETLVAQDLKGRSRAGLLREWAIVKIGRDFTNPIRAGGTRSLIARDCASSDESIELSFISMKAAACRMTEHVDGRIELASDCLFGDIVTASPRLSGLDRTGLVHNSLLLPVSPVKTLSTELRVRFAHRAFQEYFLALSVSENPQCFDGASLPDSVTAWVKEIAECPP